VFLVVKPDDLNRLWACNFDLLPSGWATLPAYRARKSSELENRNGLQVLQPGTIAVTFHKQSQEKQVTALGGMTSAFAFLRVSARPARNLMVQETILGDLKKCGYELVSVAEPDLCSNHPSRVLMRQVFGAIAQYDKVMIVAKLRSARDRKRASTGRCEGQPFYGHYDGEQAVITRMKDSRGLGLTYKPGCRADERRRPAHPSPPTLARHVSASGPETRSITPADAARAGQRDPAVLECFFPVLFGFGRNCPFCTKPLAYAFVVSAFRQERDRDRRPFSSCVTLLATLQ
jgi:Resolvase, N terminal domain